MSLEHGQVSKPSLWAVRCGSCDRVRSAMHPMTSKDSFITYELRATGWASRKKKWTCPVCLGRCKPEEFKRGPFQKSDFEVC